MRFDVQTGTTVLVVEVGRDEDGLGWAATVEAVDPKLYRHLFGRLSRDS